MNPRFAELTSPTSGTRRIVRLVGMCVLIGIVAGFGAVGFLIMLDAATSFFLGYLANFYPPRPGNEPLPAFLDFGSIFDRDSYVRWMFLILPAVGGLISGVLTFTFAPEVEGHGTDAAIQAYHFKDGYVRTRTPFFKAVTSSITIGSGGAGGGEGPIAQIGAGFGSMLGSWFGSGPDERRVLMSAGMAAGIGAIFHAPLAGALIAAEVLYRDPDIEHEVLVPSFISSITAYSVFGAFFGFHPLFRTPDYAFSNLAQLIPYMMLALVVSLGAMVFVKVFWGFRDFMYGPRMQRIPPHVKPAIGGLLTGLVAFFLPEALGTGYGAIQLAFDKNLGALPTAPFFERLLSPTGVFSATAVLLGVLALAKIVTTATSIGSGGSGGVFGPSVVIGAVLGAATGLACAALFPEMDIQPGAFALVGMAGFFAATANTPISTIIMVNEMTGNYRLLIPTMMVCIVSYMLCRRFNLYREQLGSRLDAPSKIGSMAGAVLRKITVGEALKKKPARELVVVHDGTPFPELLHRYATSSRGCIPVLDDDGGLVGAVDVDDIRRIVTEVGVSDLVIARDIARPAVTVTASESLLAALNRMEITHPSELVVVDPKDPRKIVETLSRADIIAAYNRRSRA